MLVDNVLWRPEHMPTTIPIMNPIFILSKQEGCPPP